MLRFVIGDGVPPLLLGDAMRLGQVLTNLLNNAIKFTEQGEVSVTIQRVTGKGVGAWLRFEVRDTGIGLSRKQCQRLFQTFTQADSSTTRKYGGTGLGLSISKRLVEMMGGEIGVESRLGAGSTFFFTARFDEVPEQAGVPPDFLQADPLGLQPDLEALRGAQLLLVEDNAVNRELALEFLGEAGIHADVAVNGEEALAMLERADYDGVLMDCQMPVMDGFEATRKIRADARFAALPIIALSAGVTASECDACRQSGMNDHIAKPIDSRVRNLLNLKRKADLLESQAFLDALTNIPNRRSFDEALRTEWLRAQRTARPLAIIMMDIDHFKAYNDCYGHGAGDICLKAVASALSLETLSRPADRVARLGGEEFVALLPETEEHGAHLLAERLRGRVESLHIHHQQSSVSSWVTISVGYACLVPSQENTPTQLLEEADRMLYQAKAFGRNRVYPG